MSTALVLSAVAFLKMFLGGVLIARATVRRSLAVAALSAMAVFALIGITDIW
ncbi:MAG TPA: hypothetical protein VD862_03770 [Candidatus Paceibacterota bacterium]|nr:hypothetical protein [Candidatus Paceibacterota bacterium]